MTEAERQAVTQALELQGDTMLSAIGAFGSAEQLHQFALNYNPNDGLLPCLAIAQHDACDAGTALYLYWQFSDLLFDPERRASSAHEAPEWNPAAVLDLIEKRFPSGFASSNIYFDPQEGWPLNVVQRRDLAQSGVRPEMLEPIGSLRLEQEWL